MQSEEQEHTKALFTVTTTTDWGPAGASFKGDYRQEAGQEAGWVGDKPARLLTVTYSQTSEQDVLDSKLQ